MVVSMDAPSIAPEVGTPFGAAWAISQSSVTGLLKLIYYLIRVVHFPFCQQTKCTPIISLHFFALSLTKSVLLKPMYLMVTVVFKLMIRSITQFEGLHTKVAR